MTAALLVFAFACLAWSFALTLLVTRSYTRSIEAWIEHDFDRSQQLKASADKWRRRLMPWTRWQETGS